MNVSATLAGYEATWRFRHSRRLDAWLSDQPWRGRGGVLAVRVASMAQCPATIVALTRAARAADEHGDVRVLTLPAVNLTLGVRSAIASALELPEGLGRSETIRLVTEELRHPHLFVAEPAMGSSIGSVFDEAAGFSDEIARVSPDSAATMIMLEIPARPVSVDSMDLSVGGPADGLLNLFDGPKAELWRGYVHVRLSWEVAGDLSRAAGAEPLGFARLAIGDDDGLERRLNLFAQSAFDGLAKESAKLSEEFLAATDRVRDDGVPTTTPTPGKLEGAGLYWRPAEDSLPRPAPWWARAILCRDGAGPLRYLFRSCLVCAPIAREILLRCFDLEALDRASSFPHPRANADPNLRRMFDAFRLDNPESEFRHYPKHCPATPHEPTDFASYGAILAHLPPEPARDTSRHRLRRLRNAVAHGHYVSWATVMEVQRVAASLG